MSRRRRRSSPHSLPRLSLPAALRLVLKQTAVRRYAPWFLVPLLLLGVAIYLAELLWFRPAMAPFGLPVASNFHAHTWHRVLRNRAYVAGWSDLRGNPLWVHYRLATPPPQRNDYRRFDFQRDWRSLNPKSPTDYRGSGFDRGHLVPSFAIARIYGEAAQRETFLMTAISPQRPALNQRLWQRLEQMAFDHLLPRHQEVWVMAGPIFEGSVERLSGAWWVEIPDAFFKLFAVMPQGASEPKVLAFILPQMVEGREPLDRFLVSVDEIEQRSGLDLFSALSPAQQARFESGVITDGWDLAAVRTLPPRY
jgi:endonuclease G, mitochondrial